MNQQDRKEFEIVHLKIDELKKDIVELKTDMKRLILKRMKISVSLRKIYLIQIKACGLKQRKTQDIDRTHRSGE